MRDGMVMVDGDGDGDGGGTWNCSLELLGPFLRSLIFVILGHTYGVWVRGEDV